MTVWVSFGVACVLLATLLFVPGAVFLRSLGTSRLGALCMAPLVCVSFLGVTGVALDLMGIECHAPVAVAPLLVAAVVAACVRAWLDHRARLRASGPAVTGRAPRRPTRSSSAAPRPSWRMVAVVGLYVAVGVAVTCIVFVKGLDGPAANLQSWDNVCHYDLIRSMVDSGNWSSLDTTYYPAVSGINPFVGGNGFYPAAWHALGALLVDALGVPVTLAANAVHAVSFSLVYPLGMCLLLSTVFGRRLRTVALGALCCLAFVPFPWGMSVRWACWPFCFTLCLVPATASAFMVLIGHGVSRRRRVASLVAFLCGGAALALVQPSGVFTVGVFLVPYIVWRIFTALRERGAGAPRIALAVAGFLAFVVVTWLVMCRAPFMSGVVGYYRPPMLTPSGAIDGILGAYFVWGAATPVLGLMMVVGLVAALHSRRARWVAASLLVSLVIYFVAVTGGDTPAKHLLSGFWYTEPYRTSAMCVVFAIPVVALGLQTCADVLGAHLRRIARSVAGRPVAVPLGVSVAAVGALFAGLVFVPALRATLGLPHSQEWPSDLAGVTEDFAFWSERVSDRGYAGHEQAFVQRVLEVVGPDEPVLNMPYDGSIYAYGVDGLNVYYRSMSGYGTGDEREESAVLRASFASLGEDPSVRQVVEDEGIRYVMLLRGENNQAYYSPYVPQDWEGIEDVDDDTPGLEVVLAEGDMRLYRVVD